MNVFGLILSGGESSRMSKPKALLKVKEWTLLEDHVAKLLMGGVCGVCVVVGADAEKIKLAHPSLKVDWVTNDNWQAGKFSSVLCGVKACHSRDLLLLPIDVVGVSADTIATIIDEGVKRNKNIIPTYNGKGGHPVFLTSALTHKIIQTNNPNSRLDVVLNSDPDSVRIPVTDSSILNNINTPADYNEFLIEGFLP